MGACGAALIPPCATSCVCARTHLPQLKLGRYIPHILSYFQVYFLCAANVIQGNNISLPPPSPNPLPLLRQIPTITRDVEHTCENTFAAAETWQIHTSHTQLLSRIFLCASHVIQGIITHSRHPLFSDPQIPTKHSKLFRDRTEHHVPSALPARQCARSTTIISRIEPRLSQSVILQRRQQIVLRRRASR